MTGWGDPSSGYVCPNCLHTLRFDIDLMTASMFIGVICLPVGLLIYGKLVAMPASNIVGI